MSSRDHRVWLPAALVLASGCGGGNGGPALPPAEQAQRQVEALSAPGRSVAVEAFTDNNNLLVLAPVLFPEVAALLPLGPAGADPLIASLGDPKLDGTEDGDRVRALAAHVLERWGATVALPALRAYLTRALTQPEIPFFSIQTASHAIA